MTTLGPDTRLAPHSCHACGHELDAANELGGTSSPSEGDFAICIRCGELGVFEGEPLHLRAPTPQEWTEVGPSATAAMCIWRQAFGKTVQ